jgi:hypothetical protein
LFLLGVAGDEGVARDLLDFPDVVVEQDVGDFVPMSLLVRPGSLHGLQTAIERCSPQEDEHHR